MSSSRALLVGFSVPLLLVALAAADEVLLVPDATVKATGGRVRGQITAETPSEVRIKPPAGAEQAIPLDQIAGVTYDGAPASFTLAQAREAAGALTEAADQYRKAATEAASKPFLAQAAQFGRARALGELALTTPARAAEAINELDNFLRVGRTGRHAVPAMELQVRLFLQQGQLPRANATVEDLSSIPGAADHAAVLRARVLARSGKGDQAVAALDKILGAAAKDSARRREAQLARAEALASLRKFEEAESAVREVIDESPPEAADIQAEAHNTLGDCLRAAGRPKDALLAYLKTDILYDRDKEQHPRALAQIAALWRELKQDARADEVLERLRQQYPNSPYAPGRRAAR